MVHGGGDAPNCTHGSEMLGEENAGNAGVWALGGLTSEHILILIILILIRRMQRWRRLQERYTGRCEERGRGLVFIMFGLYHLRPTWLHTAN